ncbi:DUF4245 family protein [Nocardioides sp. zg-536]|uniref:DUF4245 family protein n=1 Tax=Nocardioides faecalis TaxID=2803858 RepID=A0A938Y4C0_9ACTN|nr:DUF4245 family protein [Nocardioides faecalis]MBM9459768.1 DUF4245 family protein [Nocardioides faecalis]MBS4753455.1 DUF4245 family protein [Nocardioides faecalis]QVI58283.1 DUF4245 family protein [Nocardioides faecalis]
MSTQKPEPSGRPGRYQRSAWGLVVSLLVTVVALAGLYAFTGAFRNDFEIKPEKVDYLASVAAAQQAGLSPAYPASLPKGWIATGAEVTPGDRPVFTLRMLTDENRFVGVRQEDASIGSLVSRWVDEDAEDAEGYTVPASVTAPVAREWEGFVDASGDTAYAAEVGEETVLVFGSASAKELQQVVDSLTTAPVR